MTDRYSEKMFMIVMLCMFLCPDVKIDESIQSHMKETYGNRLSKLQAEDESAFSDVFRRLSPHFVSPMICRADLQTEIVRRQLPDEIWKTQFGVFMTDMPGRRRAAQLVSFACLYNNISLKRLASLMEYPNMSEDEAVEACRSELMSLAVRIGDSNNSLHCGCEVAFVIEDDVVHVRTQKSAKSYAETYTRLINNIKDMIHTVENMPPRSGVAA